MIFNLEGTVTPPLTADERHAHTRILEGLRWAFDAPVQAEIKEGNFR
jgi:hypothetical protein